MVDPRKVRRLRLNKRLSQSQLATLTRLPTTWICLLESNKPKDFFVSKIERIAAALDVPMSALLTPGPPQARAKIEMVQQHVFRPRGLKKMPKLPPAPPPDDPNDELDLGPLSEPDRLPEVGKMNFYNNLPPAENNLPAPEVIT